MNKGFSCCCGSELSDALNSFEFSVTLRKNFLGAGESMTKRHIKSIK